MPAFGTIIRIELPLTYVQTTRESDSHMLASRKHPALLVRSEQNPKTYCLVANGPIPSMIGSSSLATIGRPFIPQAQDNQRTPDAGDSQ